MTSYKTRKGFTLIEILVVVSIIASISSVVLVGIKAAQASGRDAARTSNSLQVRNALALYQNDHNGVPAGSAAAGCTQKTINSTITWDCKGSSVATVLSPLVPTYISHIPVEMVSTNGLSYEYITPDTNPALGSPSVGVTLTDSASFGYVSEVKSSDPVNNPFVVTVPVGTTNFISYPDTGYPVDIYSSNNINSLAITGPSTATGGTQATWTVIVLNPNNRSITYTVAWGDTLTDTLTSSASSINFNHTYAAAGSYSIAVTATYSSRSAQAVTSVTVSNPLPSFTITGPSALKAGTSGSWTFTYPAGNGIAINYRINLDWGDGTAKSALGGTTTLGVKAISHTYAAGGTYTISNTIGGTTQTYVVVVAPYVPFQWSAEGSTGLCWSGGAYETSHGCSASGATEYCANKNTGDGRVWTLPTSGELYSAMQSTFGETGNNITATGLPGVFQTNRFYWSTDTLTGNYIMVDAGAPGEAWVTQSGVDRDKLGIMGDTSNTQANANPIHTICVSGDWGH